MFSHVNGVSLEGKGVRIVSVEQQQEAPTCSAEGFGQRSSYQMKSRPLREGGVGKGRGLGRAEGGQQENRTAGGVTRATSKTHRAQTH